MENQSTETGQTEPDLETETDNTLSVQESTETSSSRRTDETDQSQQQRPKVEVGKSKIPVPASVYIQGARSGYLADLSEQIYRDERLQEWEEEEDDDEKENYEERRRRRRRLVSAARRDDYGPPGILHERGPRLRKRTSSEFGDSSIELLGPSETLDTDESDGSGELLSGIEDAPRRAGSATFNRFPERRGAKSRTQIMKSKTVGDDEEEVPPSERRRGDDERRRHERPPSSRRKRDGDWKRVEVTKPRPRSSLGKKSQETSRTPSKSPSKSPAERSPRRVGSGERDTERERRRAMRDKEDWKRVEVKKTRPRSPRERKGKDEITSSHSKSPANRSPRGGGSGEREKERERRRAMRDKEDWRRVDVKKTRPRSPREKKGKEEITSSPSKSPATRSPGRREEREKDRARRTPVVPDSLTQKINQLQGLGAPTRQNDTEKWRVRPDSKASTSRANSGDERKRKEPKVTVVVPEPPVDPAMYDEDRMKEDAVRDNAALIRLMQLCQSGEWLGVEGHLRYFEKRVRAGLISDPKPFKDLKDETTGWTPLHYAMKDSRVPIAERLVELGCDVNACTKDGFYPIHIAAKYGREDTIRFLVYKNADMTVNTTNGKQNALHLACARKAGGNTAAVLRAVLTALPNEEKMEQDAEGNSPLMIAINNGQTAACRELLVQCGEEQLKLTSGEHKDTPLHLACRRKDLELLRIFTDAGADVNCTNGLGQTPLHVAAEMGDENLLKFLYLCKADPKITDNEDRTPIFIAAMNGNTQLVDLLADKFKVSVFERARDGSTLMHIASLHGHPETAIALFKKGVPLQMPNKGGARSIHIAARNGHAGMIAKLLEKGEKVDATTNDHFTALHIAVESVKPDVVETLLGYGAQVHIKGGKNQETPLHIAARVTGGELCAGMLLKSGAEPNITMENGDTPLHVAARHGRIKIVELLLREGADPQQKAKDGDTPLHLACKYGHYKVVDALLGHVKKTKSANECTLYINMQQCKGETALHYAARLNASRLKNQAEDSDGISKDAVGRMIVKSLLDCGASTSRQSKDANETAFHYCCREGNNEILLEMLDRLTSVECMRALNRQSSKGWSPLLIASRRGHTAVVQTLLKYHARVDVFDNDGRSGLHLAAENGFQEICGILLEHKAFINAKSRVGLTALHLAATKGFTRLCIFLIQDHGAAVDALTLKKQTPLHLAAESGQLEVCRLLMGLRANVDATDDKGQKPIHLAAQSNHAEVVKLFLKNSPQLGNSFTKDGSTCAHLAAMQGSVAVLEELMKFDKQGVINARNRSTDATALQLAAEGGHADLVNTLLDAGASASDENRLGYTAAHLAAKNGHMNVLEALRNAQEDSINITSRKLGMSALHIAAFYGQTETVRDLLQFIPATSGTDPPLNLQTSFIKDLGTESGLTPLHMAAYSGEENVVRLLLNFEGVQVDAPTLNFGFNPLHLACRGGHTTVVGLLLSRSAELLESKDGSGKASLHIAAVNGHKQMVEVLLGQGAEIDAIDKELWTPLICAAKAGHLDVVRLLVESGASPLAKTAKGQSPIWFAAAENHVDVLSYLMKKDHDTYGLMEDKDFVYNLTVCGKNIDNEPIDEFVLSSPAPVDVAAKMSNFLVYVSTKEKERAKDLIAASEHCSAMATELLALAAGAESAAKVLESVDRKGTEFLDVLIECEQKEVIAHTVVQRHLQEIWVGTLVEWADWKLLLVFLACVFCPPVWVTLSMPFGPSVNKIPIVKFMSYLTSHIHLMIFLSLTAATPIVPILPIRTNLNPFWFEWMLFAWLGGLLIAEMTNPSDKSGLGFTKVAVLVFSYMGIMLHGMALFIEAESMGTTLYIRDQLFGLAILSACVQILDFLSFHYLFGPWAIIIGNLMKDLARFLAVLCIFMIGFSLMMTALNHPLHERRELAPGEKVPSTLTGGMASGVLVTPVDAFEMLFFALFGLNGVDDLKIEVLGQPGWTIIFFKMFFGIYLLVTVIVLINLLIAMMSDTYQRIEQQSDIEWKYGLAKLIRNMHRTTATPSPLNLFVDWGTWIHRRVLKARQPKNKLKWGEEPEGAAEEEKKETEEKKDAKIGAKERWQIAFKKTMPDKGADPNRLSLMQLPVGALAGEAGLAVGSTLSSGATNRIETVTDWKIIAKKYYTLVGKEEPVEEKPDGDKMGSRQGTSSHMGSSMMLLSKQGL